MGSGKWQDFWGNEALLRQKKSLLLGRGKGGEMVRRRRRGRAERGRGRGCMAN